MTWTTRPPAAPGRYLYKELYNSEWVFEVEVRLDDAAPRLVAVFPDVICPVTQAPGVWAGPLPTGDRAGE